MSFQYTSGDPNDLVGGLDASMADIQGSFTDLKTFLNERIAAVPTLVTNLPVGPVDGQEVYYLADATNAVVWHLRYRSASGSAYKWELVGGGWLHNEVATGENSSSTTYADLATVGPAIALPLAGDYDVKISAAMTPANVTTALARMSFAIGGTAATDADSVYFQTGGGTTPSAFAVRTVRKTGLTAVTLTAKYKESGGATAFASRSMRVRPVRVG